MSNINDLNFVEIGNITEHLLNSAFRVYLCNHYENQHTDSDREQSMALFKNDIKAFTTLIIREFDCEELVNAAQPITTAIDLFSSDFKNETYYNSLKNEIEKLRNLVHLG